MKISVITVCRNSAATIEQTIRSVLGQTYPDIEYIIIDGGSTDGTLDIIRHYEDRIEKWVSEPDGGLYDAMNKGIRMATGDIIGIINSDDWYAPGTVTAAVRAFGERPEADLVHGDLFYVTGTGCAYKGKRLERLLPDGYAAQFYHPTFFVRREVYEACGLFDCRYPHAADVDFVYRLHFAQVNACYSPQDVAYFRLGGVSSSWHALREARHVHDKFIGRFPVGEQDAARQAVRRLLQRQHRGMACRYLDERIRWREPSLHPGERLFLFGTGAWGHRLHDWLRRAGRERDIAAFWDNSPQMQGRRIGGIPVTGVCEAGDLPGEAVIAVASVDYFEEMSRQLESYGLVRGRDFFSVFAFKAYLTGTALPRWMRP